MALQSGLIEYQLDRVTDEPGLLCPAFAVYFGKILRAHFASFARRFDASTV